MPKPRPIDIRISEAKERLDMLQDKKRLEALQMKIAARRGRKRRRSM